MDRNGTVKELVRFVRTERKAREASSRSSRGGKRRDHVPATGITLLGPCGGPALDGASASGREVLVEHAAVPVTKRKRKEKS